MSLTTGRTGTGYVEDSLQGVSRPQDRKSVVDKIEHIGRDEVPFLSKFATKQKATQNKHSFLFRKVAEADRKPYAEVSSFTGGTRPSTQRLDNATEIFKHEDWISYAAKDTQTYGESEQSLMLRDLVMTHKKSQQNAFLGVGRAIITDDGNGNYVRTALDEDAVLAARMSLIAAPIFRSGKGTSPADSSQMAGIFHFLANTDLTQADINAGNFRGLTDWTDNWMGNIKTFDSAGDWTGTAETISRNGINSLLLKMVDRGVKPSGGAFDLYAGSDLVQGIADMYSDTRRMDMKDKEVGYMVETVVTQFGKLRLHYLPEFNSVNGLDDVVLMGNFSYAGKSFLTETKKSEPQSTETADLHRYYSDLTLEVNNAYAFAAGVGLKA